LGGNCVFRLTDRAEKYSVISPDLTRNDPSRTNAIGSGAENYGVVFALAESPKKAGLLWAGTDDGRLWITDNDGGNTRKLTSGNRDISPNCSPDGQWVYYTATDTDRQRLAKVSIQGGNPIQLTEYSSARPVVSPDGKQIACGYIDEKEKPLRWKLAIVPADGGPPIRVFDVLPFDTVYQWTSDQRALILNKTRNGVTNIWSQPVDGGPPKQLTDFKSDLIFRFDWSRTGKPLLIARGNISSDVVMISDLR